MTAVPATLRSILRLAQAQAGVGERTPWEVFYACPSASVDAFLAAAASLAPADPTADTDGASALQTLSELAAATQVAVEMTAPAALGIPHITHAQRCFTWRVAASCMAPTLHTDRGAGPRP